MSLDTGEFANHSNHFPLRADVVAYSSDSIFSQLYRQPSWIK